MWATYSGHFKLTPAYNGDPLGAFPFDGRGIMTQKMDGMFMLWDGQSQMFNRGRGGSNSGAQIHAQNPPESFYKHLPPVELEGELCYTSGEYSRGHMAKTNDWSNACLFVFDAPLVHGTYAERWAYLDTLLADYDPRYVRKVPYLGVAKSRRVIDATLSKVRAAKVPTTYGSCGLIGAKYEGGEGVMIRDPDALYVHSCFEPKQPGHKKGQTGSLYKWLDEYGNDECIVLKSPNPGANSLEVSLPNGTKFVLSAISSLGVRASDIKLGSIITFTYRGWAGGLPLHASAQTFRTERTWNDIVNNFIAPPALSQGLATGRVKRTSSIKLYE
jgi:hypothetical protein